MSGQSFCEFTQPFLFNNTLYMLRCIHSHTLPHVKCTLGQKITFQQLFHFVKIEVGLYQGVLFNLQFTHLVVLLSSYQQPVPTISRRSDTHIARQHDGDWFAQHKVQQSLLGLFQLSPSKLHLLWPIAFYLLDPTLLLLSCKQYILCNYASRTQPLGLLAKLPP